MSTAITGTPGVGKTTLCRLLKARGATVTPLLQWARHHDAVSGHDDEDDADIIDIAALQGLAAPEGYIDGHMAHLLPVQDVWLIRLDPLLLRRRLEARGYSAAKVQENWEAEAMDLILQEALDAGARVVQRDGTRRSPEELLAAFEHAAKPGHDLEPVDWSDRL